MHHSHAQGKEKYQFHLGLDAFADGFPGHAYLPENGKAPLILKAFGELFVIDDHGSSCNENNA